MYIKMRYIRAGSLKRLFSIKRGSFDEEVPKQTDSPEEDNSEASKRFPETVSFQKPTWKCFSFEEIFIATNGFCSENMVGKGGYAEVYRGTLDNGDAIAVKRLTKSSTDERMEKDFLTEIGTLGHVCHTNVSSLLGCCMDSGLYLIFQFSSRGSLASLLHGTILSQHKSDTNFLSFFWTLSPNIMRVAEQFGGYNYKCQMIVRLDENLPGMDWKTRYKIAIGTAKGLHYLHKDCPRRIIHRDIKASNVLLTSDYEPQISDFGLAKWLPSQWTHHSITPIEGTFGHLAPEYFMHGVVDEKTDVFAFGVLLLELISGKNPVDGSHQSLHSLAKPILNEGKIEKLIDPRLGGAYDIPQLNQLAFAASLCIRASSTWRPTISQALEVIMLEGETMDREKWKMPDEEEEEKEEFLGFEDLESECDDTTSFSASPHDSLISTRSSYLLSFTC